VRGHDQAAPLPGTALVTGATGGIGQTIARTLAARGTRLLLSGRRQDVLDQLSQELGATVTGCDLCSPDQVSSLAEQALHTGVDLLVANAAVPASGLLNDYSQEQIDRILQVNLRAPIALARSLAPSMIARGGGHMVFISSLSGKAVSPASSLYSATKFGLRGFALALRADLRPHGVGVSVVAPGFVREAGMFADSGAQLPRGVGTTSREQVAAAVIEAVTHNRAEVDVAPLLLRLGASIASVAPALAGSVGRRLGSERIAAEIAAGQADKRG
jgi:short-subunit dehydrogenase